jgi:hypothetical protein
LATTDFTNGVTLTDEDWFDDVDFLVYDIFGDSTTTASAAARLAPSFNNLTVAGTLSVSAQSVVQALRVGGVLSASAAATFAALATTDLSASAVAGLVVATQAQMEAGTSTATIVSPGRQHFHPSAAKFWGNASVSGGTPTLDVNYNVTSITDTATGRLTVTIATDFSGSNWAAYAICAPDAGDVAITTAVGMAAGSVEFRNVIADGTLTDPLEWRFGGFGDQ